VEENQEGTGIDLDYERHTSQDLVLPITSSAETRHSTKLFLLVQNLKREDPRTKR